MIKLFNNIEHIWLHNWEQLNLTGAWEWMIENADEVEERRKEIDKLLKRNRIARLYFKSKIRKLRIDNPTKGQIEGAYLSLNDQFSDLTGDKSKIEEWQALIILRMEARLDKANGDESAQNWINKYDSMIEQLMKVGISVDIIQARLQYAQHYGQHIDPMKTRTGDFIRIMKIVDTQARQKNKAS